MVGAPCNHSFYSRVETAGKQLWRVRERYDDISPAVRLQPQPAFEQTYIATFCPFTLARNMELTRIFLDKKTKGNNRVKNWDRPVVE